MRGMEPGAPVQGRVAKRVSRSGDPNDPVARAVSFLPGGRDARLRIRPERTGVPIRSQAESVYSQLEREMADLRAGTSHAAAEKAFFADRAGYEEFMDVRETFYGTSVTDRPAASFVQQPPADPKQKVEMQIHLFVPDEGSSWRMRPVDGLMEGVSGKILDAGGARRLFLSGVAGDPSANGREAAGVFEKALKILNAEGMAFRDVVRTWIYLAEMDGHYGALNKARRTFFKRENVFPPPASTGIGGRPLPGPRLFGLDLQAIAGRGGGPFAPVRSPNMNEAFEYGSDFSRGARVAFDGWDLIFISGTASIDPRGEIQHAGDVRRQTAKTLRNIRELLGGQGASLDDVVSCVTYVKRPEDARTVAEECLAAGLGRDVPNTVCIAEVCRPGWLVEIEAEAIVLRP